MALIVAPEPPLEAWFAAFDQQMARSAGFFTDRPVIANLAAVLEAEEKLDALLDGLEARQLRIIGVEGVEPAALGQTRWAQLPQLIQGRDIRRDGTDKLVVLPPQQAEAPMEVAPPPTSLVVDRPVRSGQSILFEDGDVTIIGSVASGADIVAGGSIHVYGALRGRAIAGLKTGAAARIFCTRLAAELVAIDGVYRTAEEWGAEVQNRAVQIRLEDSVLKLDRLD